MREARRGEVIFSVRLCGLYFHYGVYVGNNQVIQYRGKDDSFFNADIIRTSLQEFANGCATYIEPPKRSSNVDDEKTAAKAEELLGRGLNQYNLITNNCEHIANYCRYGYKMSGQIRETFWKLIRTSLHFLTDFLCSPVMIPSMIIKTINFLEIKPTLLPVYYLFGNFIHTEGIEQVSFNDSIPIYNKYDPFDNFDSLVKRCPKCGAVIPKDSEDCIYCGYKLKTINLIRCPHCSASVPHGAYRCEYCGRLYEE